MFCYEGDESPSFWMKNMYVSLDIILLSDTGIIVGFMERLPPCPMEPCPIYKVDRPYRYALEVKAGFIAEHRISKGDRVMLRLD